MNIRATNLARVVKPLLRIVLLTWPLAGIGQGIPEPSIILYGIVRNSAIYNARVTSGSLTWTFRNVGNGRTVTVISPLTNVLDQFSYVLKVPCETQFLSPVSANAVALQPSATLFDRSQVLLDGLPASFLVSTQATVMFSSKNRGTIERVDLRINAPCFDGDGHGLCDAWEIQYFGQTGHYADVDDDGDGMTNLEEFIAGTNPNYSKSFFHFISYAPAANGGFQVQWSSGDGRSYSLLRSSTLLPGSFGVIRSNIVGTPPANTFLDTNAVGSGPYFYQVLIQP